MAFQPNNALIKWIEYRLPIFSFMHHSLVEYPTPRNFNIWYQFGSIAGIVLVVQLVTGIVLAMHYVPHADHAFDSVEFIMRDVNYGWLLRYMHSNGGTMFFIAVYIHLFRGLYYGSYKAPRELLWIIGVAILLLMMATAFMGYVLPWGQMSFWAATVITSLFSAVPLVGDEILTWLWGGFAVDNATLKRFYSLHYLLPFVLVAVVVIHLWALHQHGSSNPLGIDAKAPGDQIPFHPYYTVKDCLGFALFGLFFAVLLFYLPNLQGHPDNFVPADPLQTPTHIVPEWYFLPFYAILRAVPDKLLGVVLMFGSILILFLVPWLDTSKVRSTRFRPRYKYFFWFLVIDAFALGVVGAFPPDQTFGFIKLLVVGRIATAYYFGHFLFVMPLVGWFETPRPLPRSISEAVLGGGGEPPGAPAAPARGKS